MTELGVTWIFYYDSAEANRYRDQLDADHISVGEFVGTVGGIGLILLLLNEASDKANK